MAEIMNGPLMSIALVILAGIALRYALWMGRDRESLGSGADVPDQRSEQLERDCRSLRAKCESLQNENDKICEDYQALRSALESRDAKLAQTESTAHTVAQEAHEEVQSQLNSLRQIHSEVESELADTVARLSDADTRSAVLNQQLDEVRGKLQEQLRDRQGLLEQCDEMQSCHDRLAEQTEQLRAERDVLAERLTSLAADHQGLSSLQYEWSSEKTQICSELDELVAECSNLRDRENTVAAQRDEWSAKYDQLAQRHDQTHRELDAAIREKEDLANAVELMSEQRRKIARERDELQEQLEQAQRNAEAADVLREQYNERQVYHQTEMDSAKERCEAALGECAKLQAALHEAELKNAEVHNQQLSDSVEAKEQLRTVEAANRELSTTISEMEASQIATEAELETTKQEIARLQSETRFVAQLRSERTKLMTDAAGLNNKFLEQREQHQRVLQELNQVHQGEVDALRAELQTVRASIVDQDELVTRFEAQLSDKDKELQTLLESQALTEDHLRKSADNLANYDQTVEEYEQRIANLTVEKDQITNGLLLEQENSKRLAEELETAQRTLRKTGLELSHLDLLRSDHKCLSAELDELREQVNVLRAERDELAHTLGVSQKELDEKGSLVSRIERDLGAKQARFRELQEDNNSLRIQLATVHSEKQTLEELLNVHSSTLQKLQQDSLSIETLLERQAAVQESLQEHADRLRSVALDQRQPAAERTAPEPTSAPQQELVPESREVEILAFGEKPIASAIEHARVDGLLGLVYDRPPVDADDLKRISGVGILLEQKLNRLGIYKYEQVVNLTETAIRELSKLLAFQDQIARDDWIGQARQLVLESNSRVA